MQRRRGKEQERKCEFKASLKPEHCRRMREETQIKLRKSKKEDRLKRHRFMATSIDSGSTSYNIPSRYKELFSMDQNTCFKATRFFRKILSVQESPPIGEVIASGAVNKFVEFLSYDKHPKLQFEAIWALTNVSSGTREHTDAVVSCGAVPLLVRLLNSQIVEIREQSVWCLGNIAGDSIRNRDLVVSMGAVTYLLSMLTEKVNIPLLQNITWTLTNVCRGKPMPPTEVTDQITPYFVHLTSSEDRAVVADALWGLYYISDASDDQIEKVVQTGVMPQLVSLLQHPSLSIRTPALRVIGNIASGDESQTQKVVDRAVPGLFSMLNSHAVSLRKEACWVFSNIAAGNKEQIQSLIDGHVLQPMQIMMMNEQFLVQKEITWLVSNICHGGSHEQISYLCRLGFLSPVINIMTVADTCIVKLALGIADSIITHCPAGKLQFEELGGVDKLQELQTHKNAEVYAEVMKLIETHYNEDEEVEDLEGSGFTTDNMLF